jgi:muramoyltetrapeptide carboxypeptidase LdcA involved in peptidoglycan recycling
MTRVAHDLIRPPKARAGERIAVLSPSFAAPGLFPAVDEQAMRRLTEVAGLIPVEYPTTRQVGATPQARAADINAAFADPSIRAILAVVGGEDEITVIPHVDAALARRDPKPFLGMSDNTNLHQWLWANGVASFYGGSSQVHLGPGPAVDDVHARSLRAALVDGGILEITDPGESEDVGVDWDDPRALTSFGEREPTEPWSWYGPSRAVTGRAWGGCLEVMEWILTAGRFPFDPGSSTAASCSWKPQKSSAPRTTSDGSSARLANAASSGRSARCLSPARRYPTSPAARRPRNAPGCAPSSATSSWR